ncbi:MAG TPA: hypothetical protein VI583_11320 [Cyclobacteriaceae bacterium]|nr:hypothetical protein [Cyclobacteriaceae bacterium]
MDNISYTTHFLNKLEDLYSETDYQLRYEKGNFKSGYCILRSRRIAIINKYYSLEGKINSLVDMLKELEIDPGKLSEKNRKLFSSIISARNN